MPIGNWNLQWLNHNSQRSYPLTERATKKDTYNEFEIPDSFIVALYFPIHAGMAFSPSNFFISSILVAPTGFNIAIGYDDGSGTPIDVAKANIARVNYTPNRAYTLAGIDNFYDSIGFIVLGNLDDIDRQSPGVYNFTLADAEIEADAIRPMLRGVSSLRISNNNELTERLYGHVTLVAGDNMRITTASTVVNGMTEHYITFSAVAGENLNQTCLCDIVDEADCIRQINGVPSTTGEFILAPNGCISMTPMTSGIKIEDICAQPCCGCTELAALNDQVNRFGDGITTLQNFVTRLGAEVTQMSLVVLGSRLGSSPCTTG
jgi:hypothetical protein